MMKEFVLSNDEARQVDRYTIDELKISGQELMHKAGNYVALKAKLLLKHIPGSRIDIFCGTGNNGGDGFVAASFLYDWGANVFLWICGKEEKIKGDALYFYNRCMDLHVNIEFLEDEKMIDNIPENFCPDLIIDGLLGTGFKGVVKGIIAKAIKKINSTDCPVISIDIPSGIDGDTGMIGGVAVKAQKTVTMGFLKRGLLYHPGHQYAGNIALVDLDYPKESFEILDNETYWLRKDYVKNIFREIHEDTYKHQMGKILIFAGSVGMTGAATLSALGALRSGAGLVVAAIPESLNTIMEIKLTEAMTLPLPESKNRTFCLKSLEAAKERLEWSDVVVFGPGVSGDPEVKNFGIELLKNTSKPIIVDADGLKIFHNNLDLINNIDDLILTPHIGEFARMTNQNVSDCMNNKIDVAREFVKKYSCTLVLKSYRTIIVHKDGTIAINPTGNPGMATGGTGDVLTGMIAAFRAQGISSYHSAVAGVSIHGYAGDLSKQDRGMRGLIASDLLSNISLTLKKIEQSNK